MPRPAARFAMKHSRHLPSSTISRLIFRTRKLPSGCSRIICFLASDVYSVVAEADGRVVGSNFLWENGVIAGVGPITIDPAAQNLAVGKRLMEDVIRRADERAFAGMRLVQAAYHNRSLSLYTKLGFDAREPLSNLQGPALGLEIPGRAVRPAKEEDLVACNELCRRRAWA